MIHLGLCVFVTVTFTETLRLLPSIVSAVTLQEPCAIAVITPLLSTVATLLSEVVYCNFLFVAFAGNTVTAIVSILPSLIVTSYFFTVRDVILIAAGVCFAFFLTVIFCFAFKTFFPTFAFAVIVACPALTPLTTPLLFTLAIRLLEVLKVIFTFAFAGFTVTFNFFFAPTSSIAFFAIVIFFAFTAAFVLSIVTGDAKTDTAIINAITNAVTFPLFIFLLLLYRFASFIVFSSCTIMNFTLYIACSSTHFDKIVSKSLYFHEILYKTLHDLYFSFTLDNIWISDLSG